MVEKEFPEGQAEILPLVTRAQPHEALRGRMRPQAHMQKPKTPSKTLGETGFVSEKSFGNVSESGGAKIPATLC